MDVELGLKLAKCLDEFVSTSPIFISGETDIMFILTAVLKGYTRELIKIDINELGRSIVISGEKPIQDMVMVGWKVYKKEMKMMGFTKAFSIPDGVIMDQIKARFKRENYKLTIAMPKMKKGVKGIGVKEVKVEEAGRGDYRSLQVDDDDDDNDGGDIRKNDLASGELALVPQKDGEVRSMKEKIENEVQQDENNKVDKSLEETIVTTIQTFAEKIADVQDVQQDEKNKVDKSSEETILTTIQTFAKKISDVQDVQQGEKNKVDKSLEETIMTTIQTFADKISDVQDYATTPDVVPQSVSGKKGKGLQETSEKYSLEKHEALKCDQNEKQRVGYEGEGSKSYNTQENVLNNEPSTKTEKKFRDQSTQTDPPRKPKKCCVPMIAGGSALLVTLMVFVIQLIRDQDKPKKKK